MAGLERTQIEVAVMPGDMPIVDNHVAVHGAASLPTALRRDRSMAQEGSPSVQTCAAAS